MEVNHTERVVVRVRCADLTELRNVLDALRSRRVGDGRNHLVRREVDHVGLIRGEMSGNQVVVVRVNREVVEPFSPRTGEVELRDLFQGLPTRSTRADTQERAKDKRRSLPKGFVVSHEVAPLM